MEETIYCFTYFIFLFYYRIKIMKFSFEQKNTIKLLGLLVILGGICVFVYYELKDDELNNTSNK